MSTKLKTAVNQKTEIRDYIFFTPKPHHPKRVLAEAQSEENSTQKWPDINIPKKTASPQRTKFDGTITERADRSQT
jgi:hypothetical protein